MNSGRGDFRFSGLVRQAPFFIRTAHRELSRTRNSQRVEKNLLDSPFHTYVSGFFPNRHFSGGGGENLADSRPPHLQKRNRPLRSAPRSLATSHRNPGIGRAQEARSGSPASGRTAPPPLVRPPSASFVFLPLYRNLRIFWVGVLMNSSFSSTTSEIREKRLTLAFT